MNTPNIIYIFISILILALLFSSKSIINLFANIILNLILGISFIYIANTFLSSNGLSLNINLFNGIFSGLLGIPGVICLYILKIIL